MNDKDIKFARFGGLSSVKQKGYSSDTDNYHAPPCKRGFYAFLYPYYEPFLLSGYDFSGITTKHSKFERLKDKKGNPVRTTNDESFVRTSSNWMKFWGFHEKSDIYDAIKPKKPKIFEYRGELWHHLGEYLAPNEILNTKGCWYLSDFKSYSKALRKDFAIQKKKLRELGIDTNNPFAMCSKDHLEVFIEKI